MNITLLFPGQGYQSIEMLNHDTQEFLCNHGIQKALNEVLRDKEKIFDTKFAQQLIVGTQLYATKQIEENISNTDEVEYIGFSLGEITALIASGAIDAKEGLEFVSKRGFKTKEFISNAIGDEHSFGIIRVKLTSELERNIADWNREHSSLFEKVSITNFLPALSTQGEEVTLTADELILKENIEKFGGTKSQQMVKMQCPFHSSSLEKLVNQQRNIFMETVSSINYSKLPTVFSTRTLTNYSAKSSIKDISESLAQYLVEPIQTTKTLQHIKRKGGKVIVMMSRGFAEVLKEQYVAIGGNAEQIIYIEDYLINKERNSIIDNIYEK